MFKELLNDNERGVSPVIGVILMVAITVILAAVIGAFVLGLGDQVSEQAPQSSIGFEFNSDQYVNLTHEGGQNIDTTNIQVNVGSQVAFGSDSSSNFTDSGWANTAETGDTLVIENTTAGTPTKGETVRVIWNNPSGGSSSVIAERQWPN